MYVQMGGLFTTVVFIRSVDTVEASIALPAAMDALPAATAELHGGALVRRDGAGPRRPTLAGPLVRTVGAVGVAIAGPQPRHAHGVVALEGGGTAGCGGTRRLIAAVVAVGLVVAHERRGHALPAGAAELGAGALPRHCGSGHDTGD